MRDSQKQKVYDAEFMLRTVLDNAADAPTFDFYGSSLTLPVERKFACVGSLQAYVDKVLALNWVQETWTQARCPVKVVQRRGESHAHYRLGTIAVPMVSRWALRETVVLHEIAHHLTPSDVGHGPEFAGTHQALIREIVGPEAGLIYSWCQDQTGTHVSHVGV